MISGCANFLYKVTKMLIPNQKFYLEDATIVAPKLLGMKLSRRCPNGEVKAGIIVETEAYMQDDPACHAYKGLTNRTAPMFAEGGIAYVYFIYGMYYCLNVVTGKKGSGQAVLIRALEPLNIFETSKSRMASGPGKLCNYLLITKNENNMDFSNNNHLWLEYCRKINEEDIITSSRIGITKGLNNKWRFFLRDNLFVSK